MSAQRAFANKLSKQHAAEVRRNIGNMLTPTGSQYGISINDPSEEIEPLNYEEFLEQHKSLVEKDSLHTLIDFPADDVEVTESERQTRALHAVMPEESLESLPTHIQACIQSYTSNWLVVQNNYRNLSASTGCKTSRSPSLSSIPQQEFEIELEDEPEFEDIAGSIPSSSRQSIASSISSSTAETLTPRSSWASLDLSSGTDPPISELLEPVKASSADDDRPRNIFQLYSGIGDGEDVVERRPLPMLPGEDHGHRLLVKCLQLKLELEVEPIFASLALYDAKDRVKVSENLYFDFNAESTKRMLGGHIPYSDHSTLSRACVLDITSPSPDLFLVVRLEKVLQGDMNECAEPYLKDDRTPGHLEKVRAGAVAACERLGKYRQPFAWTAVYLMNVIDGANSLDRDRDDSSSTGSLERKHSSGGGLEQLRIGSLTRRGSLERRSSERRSWSPERCAHTLDTFRPITLTVSSFFKQEPDRLRDDDLYKSLLELKRPNLLMKKLKCIPGTLKLDISPYPGEIKCCLNPELVKLHPWPAEQEKLRPVKELVEFPARESAVPNTAYRNLLYVNPKELNLSSRTGPGSARNIAVKIQLMDGEGAEKALCNIYGKSSCPEFVSEAYTSVNYHNRCPSFSDEVKMKLPADLDEQLHLLFTFYHISCRVRTDTTPQETVLGYTWLPLRRDGRLIVGDFCLPVLLEQPPASYSYIPPDVRLPGSKWLDNHKGLFSVTLTTVSSIHAGDRSVEKLLVACTKSESGAELRAAISELGAARPAAVSRMLAPLLDALLGLVSRGPAHSSVAFEAICALLSRLPTATAPLDAYIRYQLRPEATLHQEVVLQWLSASGQVREQALLSSAFLFGVVSKSMAVELARTNRLDSARRHRFSDNYTEDLVALVQSVTTEITVKSDTDPRFTRALNVSLSFFLFDLVSLIDRGIVLSLVSSYCKQVAVKMSSVPDASFLFEVKLEMIRILCSHEHFVPLNLPFATPYTSPGFGRSDNFAELSTEFRRQHYLVGLVLTAVNSALRLAAPTTSAKAVACLRDLLYQHDSDPRYGEASCRGRVAALYLPLLAITMNALPLLYRWRPDGSVNRSVALAIAGELPASSYDNFQQVERKQSLSCETTRHLLACALWVLKNLERTTLSGWLAELSPSRLDQLMQVLDVMVDCFEYKGSTGRKQAATSKDVKSKLEDVIRGQGSARAEMMQRRKDRFVQVSSGDRLRWRKDQMMTYKSNERPAEEVHLEGCLSTEVALIILDLIERSALSATGEGAQAGAFRVLVRALDRNQSTIALAKMFSVQRDLAVRFPGCLLDEESDQCGALCVLLLRRCASSVTSIRTQAAASLYLLMRQAFESEGAFARIKMQVSMSLSSLVGEDSLSGCGEARLRRALRSVVEHAERAACGFGEQARELALNLHAILSDTARMKQSSEDPELLLDLMHRIARGYQHSPELRLTWLTNMAQNHAERHAMAEAGMCYLHGAALVAEVTGAADGVGAAAFAAVTPNVLAESADPPSAGCLAWLGPRFSESGLVNLIERSASHLKAAGLFEPLADLYNVLLPISRSQRDYAKLASAHAHMQDAYTRIHQLQGRRVFGTYFRVGFYGARFADLNGDEFIYKEPTLTKLPEIFGRLESLYASRFGAENVTIIKDSNPVDVARLDPNKAYIQITYVEPYFEPWELRYRQTHFDRNYNLKRFVYPTPFTSTGKAHGELREQCKRKTILTTAMHFPYIKTRIQVVHRAQIILTPIEVAIEDIQKKTAELAAATVQDPTDPKILQMVLQGCIGATVNQGPLEMAEVFLPIGRSLTKHENKLRLCFKDFSKKCQDALKKNKQLIGADQKDYQRELERNYKKFCERLQPLVNRQ